MPDLIAVNSFIKPLHHFSNLQNFSNSPHPVLSPFKHIKIMGEKKAALKYSACRLVVSCYPSHCPAL